MLVGVPCLVALIAVLSPRLAILLAASSRRRYA
jgi:hypothetical protein